MWTLYWNFLPYGQIKFQDFAFRWNFLLCGQIIFQDFAFRQCLIRHFFPRIDRTEINLLQFFSAICHKGHQRFRKPHEV